MATVEAVLAALEARLGPGSGAPALLEGGITNRNLRVRFAVEEAVVRLRQARQGAGRRSRGAPGRRCPRAAAASCRPVLDARPADPAVAVANEPVAVDGVVLGRVTTGGYGYTIGAPIALAYLPAEAAAPGTAVEVEVFGEWIEGEVAAEPLYDPAGERVRA